MPAWNDKENERLKTLWRANIPVGRIAAALGRSESQIYRQAAKIGLESRRAAKWTKGEELRVSDRVELLVLDLSRELGRTPGAVRNRLMRVLTGKEV